MMENMRVYPRVCGGTTPPVTIVQLPAGLSPRVRGNRLAGAESQKDRGSIPACAGEPRAIFCLVLIVRVYPRVCGGTGAA